MGTTTPQRIVCPFLAVDTLWTWIHIGRARFLEIVQQAGFDAAVFIAIDEIAELVVV